MKRLVCICSLMLLTLAASAQSASYNYSWKAHKIDGSRTGVSIATADNVEQAMGKVRGSKYKAPNGKVFKGGSTVAAARHMIEAQPAMAQVKEVLAYCPAEMKRYHPQCELSNWIADTYIKAVTELTGKKVDVSVANFGGIRCDMPEGDITVDDIMSMFPFRNHFCYVELKGRDLRHIYEKMARYGVQVVGGCELVIKDRKLVSAKVGGKDIDDNATYGLATINFLLNGGDGLQLARNAVDLIETDTIVYDYMLPEVKKMGAEGKPVQYHLDNRVIILKDKIY